jgi:katanin p60 ATPase-containing subunit A1
MDGVSGSSSAAADLAEGEVPAVKTVTVLAATNRPWDLDEAIRRRLEKRVYIPLPTAAGRKKLLEINLRGMPLTDDVDYDVLVAKTDGYSGCDLASVCREAAMMPMRRKLESGGFDFDNLKAHEEDIEMPLSMEDFTQAIHSIQKSVSPDQLGRFQEWMAEFGSQ